MAPSSSRHMQKLGGAMILVVAVLCVSLSVPTVSAPHPGYRPNYSPGYPPKYPPTYKPQPYGPGYPPKYPPTYKPQPYGPGYPPKYPPTYKPPSYEKDPCEDYRPSPKHPAYYLHRHAGGYFIERPCAPGTVFDPYLCVCNFPKGKGPYPRHKPYAKPTPSPTPKPPKYAPYVHGGKSFSKYPEKGYDDPPSYDDNGYYPHSYSGKHGSGYD